MLLDWISDLFARHPGATIGAAFMLTAVCAYSFADVDPSRRWMHNDLGGDWGGDWGDGCGDAD